MIGVYRDINVFVVLQYRLGIVCNNMNNLCDLYLRYLGKRNLYGEVIGFRKQEKHSENFKAMIDWLKDLIKKCDNTDQSHVTADMIIKKDKTNVKVTVEVSKGDCHISSWEWQNKSDS